MNETRFHLYGTLDRKPKQKDFHPHHRQTARIFPVEYKNLISIYNLIGFAYLHANFVYNAIPIFKQF